MKGPASFQAPSDYRRVVGEDGTGGDDRLVTAAQLRCAAPPALWRGGVDMQ